MFNFLPYKSKQQLPGEDAFHCLFIRRRPLMNAPLVMGFYVIAT